MKPMMTKRQQDRAYDHHAFHEDAKPGDLSFHFGTRAFNSSQQLTKVGSRRGRLGGCRHLLLCASPKHGPDRGSGAALRTRLHGL